MDSLAAAGVRRLFSNPTASAPTTPARCAEPYWQGYDPDGPDDQPFFDGYPKGAAADHPPPARTACCVWIAWESTSTPARWRAATITAWRAGSACA